MNRALLQFNDNQLEEWADLEHLVPCKNLETIYLERNPLWRDKTTPNTIDPNYRRKIMLTLPWVKQIDATYCK